MTTKKDICLPQAGQYQLVITVVGGPDTLAGLEGAMQVRKTKASEAVLAEMLPEYFTVDDVNRQVVLEVPDEVTSTYDWAGWAVYDLYLGPWRLIEGRIQLDKTVTRED